MKQGSTYRKRPNWLFGLLVFSGLAWAESPRMTTLPAYCNSLYPKLVPFEGRSLNQTETDELLRFAKLSPEDLNASLNRLGVPRARSFLEKMLLLRSQLRQIPLSLIPQDLLPSLDEVTLAFPNSKRNEALLLKNREALSRRVLEGALDRASERLAQHLGERSTPLEKLETFKYFLSRVDAFDASWFHQTKLDSLIDLATGIQTKRISEEIQRQSRKEFNEKHQGEETYSFAGPELLLTPYTEILNIFQGLGLKPGEKIVDLGAGFGRLGLALAAKYPSITITGYEIVKDRIAEGARVAEEWGLQDRVHLIEQNLADPRFRPESSDIYFAFNPVSGSTFDKILEDLRQVGVHSGKPFRLVLFGPSPFEKADAQPWLKEVESPKLPKGDDLKVYEFVPEKAAHTQIVTPKQENPFELKKTEAPVPEFPKSIPFDARTRSIESENPSSFLSPKYFGAWAQAIPYQISKLGKLKLLHTFSGSEDSKKEIFLEPFGGSAQEKAEGVERVLSERKAKGIQAEFTHLSPEVAKALSEKSRVQIEVDPHLSDYVYKLRDLAELQATKRLRDRSHQVEQFRLAHPQATLEVLSQLPESQQSDFLAESEGFLSRWAERRLSDFSGTDTEKQELRAEIQTASILRSRLKGSSSIQVALHTSPNGPIIAYASGEIRPGPNASRVLHIYVQKSDGTKNAVPFLNQALLQEVLFHPERYGEVDLVNMMDASNPGLKQFKKQYGPDPSLGRLHRASLKSTTP